MEPSIQQVNLHMQLINNLYRPQYHFTPPQNWMNDPCGLVYHRGEYHLFYQHNPNDIIWGPMHWGHTVSRELVHWQYLPIALSPDEIGENFSGSAVTDWNNTAGFGEGALVIIFTQNLPGKQQQCLSYSLDNGHTWVKYDKNPIIKAPDTTQNFRDPKVFWHTDETSKDYWVMALASGNTILFYTSANLIDWTPVSSFGNEHGLTGGTWETPDLFQLLVDDGPHTRWVLTVGVENNFPGGGSGMQYFVGSFDGETFISENPKSNVLRVDFGADFYAAQSWNQAPGGRRIWLGWMNNWSYANLTPASNWRGALSIPRQLSLVSTPEGNRLRQQPIAELENLRTGQKTWNKEYVQPDNSLKTSINCKSIEIMANIQIEQYIRANQLGIRLETNKNESTIVNYNVQTHSLSIDRTKSGIVSFSPDFPSIHTAKMQPINGTIQLHIFVDHTSVEVFGNDGRVVFTEQIFSTSEVMTIELYAIDGAFVLNSMDIYELESEGES